jgi:DNA-binding response OmpR family regulator
MRRRSGYRSDIRTLDIDAQNAVAGIEVAPDDAAGRVLLLEDRDDFREVLRDHLTGCSYHVTAVRSGVEGLREIMKSRFDIIICDMMMPRVGGEMFYWAVTRVRPAAGQRFIFFTGHQNDPAIKFFFQRVKATVLIKPFKLAELDAVIRDVLRRVR